MMSADAIPQLDEDQLYELCPVCHDEGECCLTCFDEGLVPHTCPED